MRNDLAKRLADELKAQCLDDLDPGWLRIAELGLGGEACFHFILYRLVERCRALGMEVYVDMWVEDHIMIDGGKQTFYINCNGEPECLLVIDVEKPKHKSVRVLREVIKELKALRPPLTQPRKKKERD